jgi:outer membrane lipoprotein-sorting protein
MKKILYSSAVIIITVLLAFLLILSAQKDSLDDIYSILDRTSIKYNSIGFYKSKTTNVYSKKGFEDEIVEKKKYQSTYTLPSNIEIKMEDEKNIKTLISENGKSELFINSEEKEKYDDVYWGLTTFEFGNGPFFKIEKILILKERGKGKISIFENLINPQLLGEEEIEGISCYKIQGQTKTDELAKETYWIDKELFLIRQYEYFSPTRKIPDGYFKTVETYSDIEAR